MYNLSFGNTSFEIAILIKHEALSEAELQKYYLDPLGDLSSSILALSLDYGDKKKPSAQCRRDYLAKALPKLGNLGVRTLVCADAEYFKTLTKQNKAEPHLGNVLPCAIKDHESMHVIYAPNYQSFFANPLNQDKLDLALKALTGHLDGSYVELGTNVLKEVYYPETDEEIMLALGELLHEPVLTVDIEAYSLKHYKAGIGTISFSKCQHTAVAFKVDTVPCEPYEVEVWDKKDKKFKIKIAHNKQVHNPKVKSILKHFFLNYAGKHVWHNFSYDLTVLIYELFMDDLLDRKGLLTGLEVMLKNAECTQLITYLATNTTAGNKLGLKDNAHEYVGNYAIDVQDIRLQKVDELLEYNAVDTCATYYVLDKHYLTMVLDEQLEVYLRFKEWSVDIIDMQLTGACLDMDQVLKAEVELSTLNDKCLGELNKHPLVQAYRVQRSKELWDKDLAKRRADAKNPDKIMIRDKDHYDSEPFNPNSPDQLQTLLFEVADLPVTDRTKSKQPATGSKVLDKLAKSITDESKIALLNTLIEYKGVSKILASFIPAFKEAEPAKDGMHYLFGSFKLGGTVSGRMSSAKPNMQQIPSGSTYAKIIKKCFTSPPGWIFCGADSASLEDRIDTLLTKDPNKEKVYTDNYDGHCLRAYSYFGDQMPDLRMAEEGDRVFEVTIGSSTHHIKCGTLVSCPVKGTIPIEEYVDGMA